MIQQYRGFKTGSRTLPLDATAGYAKIAMMVNSEAGEGHTISDESRQGLSYVLGQNYTNARFTGTDINADREIGLLTKGHREISQFHQGAGESRVCFKTIKLTKAKCKREKQPHGSRRLFSHTA